MNNNYGTSNMNQSFGGYSSKQNESTKAYAGATGSPSRQKPVPAGILNSKTLAEENLKGFRLRNL
jgi:hypothetical protein